MTDDPRVNALRVFLYEHRCVGDKEKLAPLLLAGLDAVDPLRQPVSQDRVEAAKRVLSAPFNMPPDTLESRIADALAAADRVPAPAKSDFPPWSREMARLMEFVAVVMPRRDWTSAELKEYRAAVFAAFPETTDVG